MLVDGDRDGTSQELTETDAAPAFESYLSSLDEDQGKPEATPTQEAPESEPDTAEEASTEPAGAEEGTEAAETDEETDETEEAPAPEAVLDPNLRIKVKVDGQEEEHTLEEVLKGYSRTADYTRKTQELAAQRKSQEAEAAQVREERQMYAARLAQLDQAITDATPQEPDWDKVQIERPQEFATLRAQWSLHKERQAALQVERQRAEQAVMADQQIARQQYLQAEQTALLEAFPDWKDEKVANTAKAEIVAYVKDMGYTVEEIAQVTDHRIIKLIAKAMKYDKAQEKKPKITERIEKVKVVTPGPGKVAPKPISKLAEARQRLAKAGNSREAGEAAMLAYLDAE